MGASRGASGTCRICGSGHRLYGRHERARCRQQGGRCERDDDARRRDEGKPSARRHPRRLACPTREIGLCGSQLLDLKKFKVDFAYTIDCCALGEIVWETFNACSVSIRIKGVTAHPMSAKGVLVNPLLVATDLINRFDRLQTPGGPRARKGYWWFTDCEANAAECRLTMNIRGLQPPVPADSARPSCLRRWRAWPPQRPHRHEDGFSVDVYSNIADSLGDGVAGGAPLQGCRQPSIATTPWQELRRHGRAPPSPPRASSRPRSSAASGFSYAEFLPLPSLHKSLEMTLELVRLTAGIKTLTGIRRKGPSPAAGGPFCPAAMYAVGIIEKADEPSSGQKSERRHHAALRIQGGGFSPRAAPSSVRARPPRR